MTIIGVYSFYLWYQIKYSKTKQSSYQAASNPLYSDTCSWTPNGIRRRARHTGRTDGGSSWSRSSTGPCAQTRCTSPGRIPPSRGCRKIWTGAGLPQMQRCLRWWGTMRSGLSAGVSQPWCAIEVSCECRSRRRKVRGNVLVFLQVFYWWWFSIGQALKRLW